MAFGESPEQKAAREAKEAEAKAKKEAEEKEEAEAKANAEKNTGKSKYVVKQHVSFPDPKTGERTKLFDGEDVPANLGEDRIKDWLKRDIIWTREEYNADVKKKEAEAAKKRVPLKR